MPPDKEVPSPVESDPTNGSSSTSEETDSFDFGRYSDIERRHKFEREQVWLNELAKRRLQVVRWLFRAAPVIVISLVGIVILAIITFAVHFFIPVVGWLTLEEQARLTSWYSSVARIAFPVLLVLNPWIIRKLSDPSPRD